VTDDVRVCSTPRIRNVVVFREGTPEEGGHLGTQRRRRYVGN
jgi:hypothetical protein